MSILEYKEIEAGTELRDVGTGSASCTTGIGRFA